MPNREREISIGCRVIYLEDGSEGTIIEENYKSDEYTIRFDDGVISAQPWRAIKPYGSLWEQRKKEAENNKQLDERRNQITRLFPNFYHLTHCHNLDGILKYGIISRSAVAERQLVKVDISEPGAQRRRSRRDPIYDRVIQEYVPLYVNPKNPMLSARRQHRDELLILEVSRKILDNSTYIFCDGNAASGATRFSQDILIIDDSVDALTAKYWKDLPDGGRRRCAEVLVYPRVPPELITRGYCYSHQSSATQIGLEAALEIKVDKDKFL